MITKNGIRLNKVAQKASATAYRISKALGLPIQVIENGIIIERTSDGFVLTIPLLIPTLKICGKAFLFDNSGETMVLIPEVIDGQIKLLVREEQLPNLLIIYVLNKL